MDKSKRVSRSDLRELTKRSEIKTDLEMSYYKRRILFVGGRANLDKIYNNTPDSSSETKSELAFRHRFIDDYDYSWPEGPKINGTTTKEFTKDNADLFQQILDKDWYECLDIRDVKNYGDFACLNCEDFEPYIDEESEQRNDLRAIEAIKKLPEGTLFHFAECWD